MNAHEKTTNQLEDSPAHDNAASSSPQLSILNPTPARLPGPRLLHQLVASTPSTGSVPAIDYLSSNGKRFAVSYEQFHWSSDILAGRITNEACSADAGSGPGVVPVLIPQCPELYIAQLAILKSGGAFCPLNLDAPSDRIKFILQDIAARVIITTPELISKFDGIEGVSFIAVDGNLPREDAKPNLPHLHEAQPTDLAYVMYTSGSTGTPKAVGISHDAAAQSLLAHDRHIPHFSRFLQFAAPTFDVSVFEIFFPFLRGATLVSCDRAELLNDLPGALTRMDVDACELTPTVAGSLLRRRENAPSLKVLLTIGEMLTEPVVKEFGGDAEGESMLWAMYGPTEATIHCTLEPAFQKTTKPANIGFPLDSVSAFILREPRADTSPSTEPEVLPLGETGELAVGGHQLATGYINRPEQTAAVFIESAKYGRLYRTGDRARMWPDGRIECMGRISDGQVKLRGQRIELGEIEQAALRTDGCHGAVAAVVAGILVLFCTIDNAVEESEKQILGSCRSWLPRFMVPGDLVLMQEFPRLPSGKVDRKQLVAGYTASASRRENNAENVMFADEMEEEVCDLATETLGIRITPSSALASCGLDSLKSIQLAAALRRKQWNISAVDVLGARTPADLCTQIRRVGITDDIVPHSDTAIDRSVVTAALAEKHVDEAAIDSVQECTPLQSSMLAETARMPQLYCNWVELSFPGQCSVDEIRGCLQKIAQTNQILRSGFVYCDGRFVQVVWTDFAQDQVRQVLHFERHWEMSSDDLLRPIDVQVLELPDNSRRRVLLRIHHSLYDGWTMDLIIMDLNSLLAGENVPDRTQFKDIAVYQATSAKSSVTEKAKQFWAENLLGFQPASTLELRDRHLDSLDTSVKRLQLKLDPSSVKKVADLIQCSPQSVFQAALIWLWSTLTGQDDVCIGTVMSGRTLGLSGIESVMGPCMETAPLRSSLAQARSIRELIENIHASNRAMLPHSSLTMAEIKRAAGYAAAQSLYDVLFVYQESLYSGFKEQVAVREVAHQDFLETGLLLEIEPRPQGFICSATYHSAVWPDAHIEVLQRQYQHVLEYMLGHVEEEIASIRLSLPSELRSQFNSEPPTLSGDADLAFLVERTAERIPGEPAVQFAHLIGNSSSDTETISYRELNELANQMARHVQTFDVLEGEVVAIIMEKSIRLYAGILAILKAGCAYLPLLPSTPIARIELILTQANTRLCLTDDSTEQILRNAISCPLTNMDNIKLAEYPSVNLEIPLNPSRVANIIYTSGSTGVPKGVCVTQLNIASNLDVLSRIYPPIKPASRLLQSCSQAFDVSVFEIFYSWTRGMCLCSAANDVLFEDLERAIREMCVTHLSMTPTVAALVDPRNVPGVELLVTSGEPMTRRVADMWGEKLFQGYGPSETTNICTVKQMGARDVIRHLGHSFQNTSAFVLYPDSYDLVPLGGVGEFCFGGDQVVQGYLHLPELTAERFIEHPEFGRLYRSGDMGRMLPDGSLVIIGRVDDQIKLRGQRVELNEINAAMSSSAEVKVCVTLLLEHHDSQQLVAFYVPTSSPPTSSSLFLEKMNGEELEARTREMFALLRSRLPGYMVPTYLLPVSAVPLTPAGKVDKSRLRREFAELSSAFLSSTSDSSGQNIDDGDWTEEEKKIAATLSAALEIDANTVGRWTPFANVGVDSISAIKMSKALAAALQTRVPVSLVLQTGCVAQLAKGIASSLQHDGEAPTKRDTAAFFSPEMVDEITLQFRERGLGVEKVLPCMPLQEAMLAVSSGTDAPYVEKMLFRLAAPLESVEAACRAMCARQGILRTCFVTTQDARHPIAQIVRAETCEKALFRPPEQGASVDEWVAEHVKTLPEAMDSFQPPVSFSVFQQEKHVLLSFVCHHALYDGVAMDRLLFEFEQLVKSKPLDPAPAYDPFLSFALNLPTDTDAFWKPYIGGFTPTLLAPVREGSQQVRRGCLAETLPLPLSQVEGRSRDLGVSLLATCQSAWAICLSLLLESSDVCFGNVFSGRSVPVDGVEDLVAPCFNTLPVRARVTDSRRNIDLMKKFQRLNPEIMEYQFTPLRGILRMVGTEERRRLFDTMLLVQMPTRELDGEVWKLIKEEGDMDFALVCEVTPNPKHDAMEIKLHYDKIFVSTSSISQVYDLFSHAFNTILTSSSSHVTSLDMLPPLLQRQLSKLDLKVEKASKINRTLKAGDDTEQWDTTESLIRLTLSRLASVPERQIRRTTTIYQLGLDSISAVQIASTLRKQGLRMSATDVMERPTCKDLAELAAERETEGARSSNSNEPDLDAFRRDVQSAVAQKATEDAEVEVILPCTPLQVGLITEFVRSQGETYFNFVDMAINAEFTTDALVKAWELVTSQTPMLRTGFISVNHSVSTYAMVQFPSGALRPSISTVASSDFGRFSLEKWRLDATHRALSLLERPPWALAIVEDEDSVVHVHLAIHHALYDATSLQMILDKVARALRDEDVPPAPETAAVVSEVLNTISDSEGKDFSQQLAHNTAVTKFPVLTPLQVPERRVRVSSRTSQHRFETLEASARKAAVSMQAAIQAAWTRILSSYLGEAAVTFGVVLSGRTSETTAKASFPCISTVPIVAANRASNHELMQSMMQYNSQLHRFQHLPLGQIQKWLGRAGEELFDTLIAFQKLDVTSGSVPWEITNDQGTVEYPVSLEVEPVAGSLQYRLTFYDDVVPQQHAELLLEQFDAILSHLLLSPEGTDEDLARSNPSVFAITPAAEPVLESEETLLHHFVEYIARRSPDKTALQFVTSFDGDKPEDRTWTFEQLNSRGDRVASILASHVRRGQIVAVCFDKCPEAHFAILGVLKAGCAFVALDPGAPPSRQEFIIKDSGAAAFLVKKGGSVNPEFEVSIPTIQIDEEELARMSELTTVSSSELPPSSACYCLYTSGTTGTPKGCVITHDNAVQAMLAFQKLFTNHWDENSKWLQFASFHFDVSVLEQYWTWSVGIPLVAAPRDLILEDLAGTISRLEITHIDLTPSLARLLHPDDVPSLCRGVFITGGEQLKQEILDVWGDKAVIHNFYGPTEATIGVTSYPCVPRNGRSSNIGRQFPNVGTYILCPGSDVPVLRGGVGELCVSGRLVGQGYLNRDDLTEERFPTLANFGERVYRTGDLVRILHDGCFDFLGRADDQVKLRGQRLEIGEINHAIRKGVSEITDVVTLVIRQEKLHKDFLVSFVVVGEAKGRDCLEILSNDDLATAVKEACQHKLPLYMVPTYVLQLPFIPLSANNKAEFKSLRKLFEDTPIEQLMASKRSGAENSASLGEPGERILKALKSMQVLGEDDVITDNSSIFDLGIDSISVARFAHYLKAEGVQATPSTILKNPVIGRLIEAINTQATSKQRNLILETQLLVQACRHRNQGLVCTALGISPDQTEYVAPCTALQQGMISRSRTDEHKGAYFNTFQFHLASHVSTDRLRDVWQDLFQAHSILRTKFVETSEGFVQVAVEPTTRRLSWFSHTVAAHGSLAEDLSGLRQRWSDDNEGHISRPLECAVVSHQNSRYLVVNIFHGLYDATSFDLLLEDVTQRYSGRSTTPPQPPPFFRALLHGPLRNFGDSRPFWEDHLQGASFQPLLPLADRPSPEALSLSKKIPFEQLAATCRSFNVTPAALVQALWISVLQEQCHQTTIGLILSGRALDLENADRVIGPLFNTVPFHVRGDANETWPSLARRCHHFNASVLPFQHVPLRDVQKWCSKGKPLFDTLFSFQKEGFATTVDPQLWEEVQSEPNPDYPLAFEAVLCQDGNLQTTLVTQPGIADEGSLQVLLDALMDKALHVVDNSGSRPFASPSTSTTSPTLASVDDGHVQLPAHEEIGSGFAWSQTAERIREEIARLAQMPATSIKETTSLLELGLDSIDTIKLSARLRKGHVVLSNSQLIKGQTIKSFMQILKDASTSATSKPRVPSETATDPTFLQKELEKEGYDLKHAEAVLPPTPLQEAMVAEMIQSGFHRYFNHDIMEVPHSVDIEQLKKSWQHVVETSPILRTGFVEVDNPLTKFTYCQVVNEQAPQLFAEANIEHIDELISVTEGARDKAQKGQGRTGLLQLTVVKLRDCRYLVLSIAHALYDGWSLDLLHRNVEAAYRGEKQDIRTSPAAYLDHIAQSVNPDAHEFWSSYLSRMIPTHVEPQRPMSSTSSTSRRVHRVEAASTISATTLRQFAKDHAISLQVVGQAAWATVLSTLVKSLDITFGVVLSGRDSEDSEDLMFPTMNTVAVRTILHGSVSALLQYMQDNIANINLYKYYPLRQAKAATSDTRGLFNTLFILQQAPPSASVASGEKVMKSIDGISDVEYPVCVEMEIVGKTLVWRTACAEDYFSERETHRLLHLLDIALSFMIRSPQAETLDFAEDGMSICGLPRFQLPLPSEESEAVSSASDTSNPPETDWTELETTIRKVLAEVAGIETLLVRKSQSIYHLGLDSISAIKASSILRKKGVSITVRNMLKAKSITEMAKLASGSEELSTISETTRDTTSKLLDHLDINTLLDNTGIPPAAVEHILPATPMQVHMLSVWQNTDGEVFFPQFHYELRGISDLATITSAWKRLCAEFSILRVSFIPTDDRTIPVLAVVLTQTSDAAGSEARQPGSRTQLSAPQDVAKAFVVCSVERQATDAWQLKLQIHHALYDAVSLPRIVARFQELCENPNSQGVDDGLRSWARFASQRLLEPSHHRRREFWTRYLESTNGQPQFTPTGEVQVMPRVAEYRESAVPDVATIAQAATSRGVSIQALFLAAYARVLARRVSRPERRDMVFGIYLASRGDGLNDGVGRAALPTLSLVPLVVRNVHGDNLIDSAKQVQEDLHEIASPVNANVGLWEIFDWTGVQIDTFVNFLTLPDQEVSGTGRSGEVTLSQIDGLQPSTNEVIRPATYPLLAGNEIKNVYSDAVDVEAAVRNGALDIGVFGATDKLGVHGAAEIIDSIVHVLHAVVGSRAEGI